MSQLPGLKKEYVAIVEVCDTTNHVKTSLQGICPTSVDQASYGIVVNATALMQTALPLTALSYKQPMFSHHSLTLTHLLIEFHHHALALYIQVAFNQTVIREQATNTADHPLTVLASPYLQKVHHLPVKMASQVNSQI